MDINEFQNKLKDIQTLALNNGKQVRADLVEKFLEKRAWTRINSRRFMTIWRSRGSMLPAVKKRKAETGRSRICAEKKGKRTSYVRGGKSTFGLFEDFWI